jgi:RNA polymerase I-specific transcription initiation factor RRN6
VADACVLLRSRLNNLSQTYVVAGSYATSVALISSSGPTLLELDVDEPGHTLQVAMEPCRYQGDTTSSIPSLGRAYLAQGLSFYKLFMFRSNLSVHEIIVYATPSTAARETSRDEVKDLSWTIVFRPKKAVRTIGDIQEMDDFLQPEGIEAMTEPQSKLLSQVPRLTDRTEMDTTHRVVEHVLLYNTLSHDESDTGTTAMSLSVPVMVTQLRMRLSDSDYNAEPPMGTLLEFAAMKLDVSDVDEASLALQDLLDSQPQGDATVEARQIASNRLLHVAEGELPSISGLYDSILQSWVAPLPPHVSRGVRQQKERLARRIAAEVTSASIRVLENDMQGVVAESQPEVILDGGIAMPILPSLPVSSQWTSSQPLPTPPSSQSQFQPASQSFSSLSQASSFTISTLADPLMRLRKHLSFNEKTVPQEVMPDSVSRLLSQWQPGADPRAYDWNTAERATRIEADEEIDQQQLDKARRRKERREKRQRREDELAQVQPSNQPFVQPSSQPFTFVKPAIPRSSPGPMLPPSSQAMGQHTTSHVPLPGASSQSQWFGSFPLIQSQVEPGKFGGRPDKKKKKKARVSGF